MKKIKFILLMFSISASLINHSFAQEHVTYEDVKSGLVTKGKFESYSTKDGSEYKIGDRVEFGTPSGVNGKFVTIQQVDLVGTVYVVGAEAINTSAEIKKIRISGNKRAGYKVNFQTKGISGVDNYFVNIEDAILVGEIKSDGMTSDQALEALKKAKDKLDLGLITEEEFNSIREELSKFID